MVKTLAAAALAASLAGCSYLETVEPQLEALPCEVAALSSVAAATSSKKSKAPARVAAVSSSVCDAVVRR